MRVLVDTQCWLWMTAAPERLSPDARAIVETPEHDLYLSAASAWEIAIKYSIGKLTLPEPPAAYVPSRMEATRVRALAIDHAHALQVSALPRHHRDPFDRLLIAQAQLEDLTILTADSLFDAYEVATISAA
jgi:PIN domain nuclease of toxin-antitoxin system